SFAYNERVLKRSGKVAPPATQGFPRLWLVPIVAFAICALYPRHSYVEYRNVNEQARLYLVKAIVEEGTLQIDGGIAKYGDLQDKAVRDGHFYCDKPVGL